MRNTRHKKVFLRSLFLLAVVFCGGYGKQLAAQNATMSIAERHVAERDFFALTAMEDDQSVRQALAGDPTLAALRERRKGLIKQAASSCHDAHCYIEAFLWSDGDIATVSMSLQVLSRHGGPLQRFIDSELRSTRKFVLYEGQPTESFIASVWKDDASAMNHVLLTYGEGVAPLYQHIDAMRYDPKSIEFLQFLQASTAMLAEEETSLPTFASAGMEEAVFLLAANDRLDAGRFDPLDEIENKSAVERVPAVDWKRFPYTILLVLGEGPELPDVALSPLGRIRVELAVSLYREGKAPFILVSGGSVHPMLTRFIEAIEMRRELVEQWNIPASSVLIDPYARHTTTNLRNAAREVFRYHIPTDRPMLIVSDAAQIGYVMRPSFEVRCRQEMHLVPWLRLTQLSPTQVVMLPNRQSLQEDATDDPLDP